MMLQLAQAAATHASILRAVAGGSGTGLATHDRLPA